MLDFLVAKLKCFQKELAFSESRGKLAFPGVKTQFLSPIGTMKLTHCASTNNREMRRRRRDDELEEERDRCKNREIAIEG
jgi:hypothetical protein